MGLRKQMGVRKVKGGIRWKEERDGEGRGREKCENADRAEITW